MRRFLLLALVCLGLLFPAAAQALGGNYVFEGGSPAAQSVVKDALDKSQFDYSQLPQITIAITNCGCAGAGPGRVLLDESTILATQWGSHYYWAIIQHEFAHQVDYFLMDGQDRRMLHRRLGGVVWAPAEAGVDHDLQARERFADVFTWAFWPSRENILRDEAESFAPDLKPWRFRALIRAAMAA